MRKPESVDEMRAYWEQATLEVLGRLLEQRQEFLLSPLESARMAVEVADFLCGEWDAHGWEELAEAETESEEEHEQLTIKKDIS